MDCGGLHAFVDMVHQVVQGRTASLPKLRQRATTDLQPAITLRTQRSMAYTLSGPVLITVATSQLPKLPARAFHDRVTMNDHARTMIQLDLGFPVQDDGRTR